MTVSSENQTSLAQQFIDHKAGAVSADLIRAVIKQYGGEAKFIEATYQKFCDSTFLQGWGSTGDYTRKFNLKYTDGWRVENEPELRAMLANHFEAVVEAYHHYASNCAQSKRFKRALAVHIQHMVEYNEETDRIKIKDRLTKRKAAKTPEFELALIRLMGVDIGIDFYKFYQTTETGRILAAANDAMNAIEDESDEDYDDRFDTDANEEAIKQLNDLYIALGSCA